MTEYEAKIKEAANDIKYLRSSSGAMYGSMIFGLISILLANKKINKVDLETILEVERNEIKNSVKSYVESNYGQENAAINRTEDVKQVEKLCLEYVDEIKNMIVEISKKIGSIEADSEKSEKRKQRRIARKAMIIPRSEIELNINKGDNDENNKI